MRIFRVLFLDGNGRVVDFQELRVTDDTEAIAHARFRCHREPVEVWQAGRMVALVEPEAGRGPNRSQRATVPAPCSERARSA